MNLAGSLPLIEREDLFFWKALMLRPTAVLVVFFAVEIGPKWIFGHQSCPPLPLVKSKRLVATYPGSEERYSNFFNKR